MICQKSNSFVINLLEKVVNNCIIFVLMRKYTIRIKRFAPRSVPCTLGSRTPCTSSAPCAFTTMLICPVSRMN